MDSQETPKTIDLATLPASSTASLTGERLMQSGASSHQANANVLPIIEKRTPPPDVRENIEALLEQDATRLGDAYRGMVDGLDPAKISEQLGINSVAWCYAKNRDIKALLEGELPNKPSAAGYTIPAFKSLLKEKPEERTKEWLELTLSELEAISANQKKRDEEVANAGKLADTEFQTWQGVYVYTFPHYHYNPVDGHSNPPRTIMKIGRTAGQDGIRGRISQQIGTAAPEEPLLYRAYRTEEIAESKEGIEELSRDLENQFHTLLDSAGHTRTRDKKEWFLTSLDFLDALAETWGLEIGKIFDPDSDTY